MDNPRLSDAVASLLHKLESFCLSKVKIPPDLKYDLTKLKDTLPLLLDPSRTHDLSLSTDYLEHFVWRANHLLDLHFAESFLTVKDDEEEEKGFEELRLVISRLAPLFKSCSDPSEITQFEMLENRETHRPRMIGLVEQLPAHLFRLVVYCSIYPKGHRFVIETLVNMWMAQEGQKSQNFFLFDTGFFKELLSRGIFLKLEYAFGNGSSRRVYSCEMSPLVHDETRRLAAQELVVFDTRYSEVVGRQYKHIAFNNKGISHFNLEKVIQNCVKATSLMCSSPHLNGSEGQIIRLGSNLRKLCVLDLSGCQFKDFPCISLYSLRYLSLSGNVHLKLLNIEYFPILETFDIDGCVQLDYIHWVDPLNRSLKLRNLYLTTRQTDLSFPVQSIQVLEISRCVQLTSIGSIASFISRVISVEILRIFECPRLHLQASTLAFLEELVLHNCASLVLDCGKKKGLPLNLKRLELVGLPMVQLPNWLQFAMVLKYFMIADCPQLQQLDNLQHLISLQELCIYDCPNLRSIPYNALYSLPNLSLLDVRNCPNFTGTPTWFSNTQMINAIPSFFEKSISTDWAKINKSSSLSESKGPESLSKSPSRSNFLKVYFNGQMFSPTQEPNASTALHLRQCDPYFIVKSKMKRTGLQKSLPSLSDLSDIDGQIQNQKYSISQEPEAQTASHVNQSDPYFVKSQMNRIGMLIDNNHWRTLALVFKAIMRMKTIARVNRGRELTKLHCCLFPNDYEFERETLVQLWMAVGYLGEKGAKNMENVGNRRFDTLLEEQYILPARVDILTRRSKYKVNFDKITTLLNEMQTIQNKDLRVMLEDDNAPMVGSKCWHVSIVSNHIDQGMFETLKTFNELRTLLFVRDYGSSLKHIPSDLFLALKSIQALDLSGSHITELPSSIGSVTQLRYLDLSFTLIESLPDSIDRLHQLQTLKLEGCRHLHILPDGMKELIDLRYLDFDVLGQLTCMPKGIGALTKLRSLSAFIVDSREGCSIGELRNMNSLRGSFCISGLENSTQQEGKDAALFNKKYITQLQLRWNDYISYNTRELDDDTFDLVPNSRLEELQILYYPGLKLPFWMDDPMFTKLVSITLLKCAIDKIHIQLGRLPNLRYLNITLMYKLTRISRMLSLDHAVSFPKLETLLIDGMPILEAWEGVSYSDYPFLSKLIIGHCPKLSTLPFLPHLQSLKHLEISHCKVLKPLSDCPTFPPSLETLVIDTCPLLKKRYMRGGEGWFEIENISEITIDLKDLRSTQEHGAADDTSSAGSDSDSEGSHDDNIHPCDSC